MKQNNTKKILLGLVGLAASFLLIACSAPKDKNSRQLLNNPTQENATTMGTFVQVTVYDKGKSTAAKKAIELAKKYNDLATVDKSGSEIDAINNQAGVKAVSVSEQIYDLIKSGYKYSAKNYGYDISIGPLSKLWHIGFSDAKKPSQSELNATIPLIDYQKVKFDDQAHSVYLAEKGMQLDLGSIAKGYVAMLMVNQLKEAGVTTAVVDLGSSSIYVIGHSPRGDDKPWNIGIKNPNDPKGSQLGILEAANQHVNSSGIYERFLEVDGHKYSHILNPKTGYPFDNDIASVTLLITGEDATNGDGLSTLIYAMGTKKGYEYVESLKNVQAVFVDKNNKVYITPGLKGKFSLSNQTDFKIGNIKDLK